MIRENRIAEGVFGIVYSVFSPISGRTMALKRNLTEKESQYIGVLREVDILCKLRSHPYIVFLDKIFVGEPFQAEVMSPLVGEDRETQRNDKLHFVFPVASCDLDYYIKQSKEPNFKSLKRYMTHILLGLEYLHKKKIIHRDLKPSNILIIDRMAKIADFGLSKPYTFQGDQTPSVITSWYRAPEVMVGYPHYEYKIDVWSVGCIFFEMISGQPLLFGCIDNNNMLLSRVLKVLHEDLPVKTYRELITSNKWKKIKLTKTKMGKRFPEMLDLSEKGLASFEKGCGSYDKFIDLLKHMLCFDWEKRYTSSDCLSHPFFNDYRDLIRSNREKFRVLPTDDEGFYIVECNERKWMADIALRFFNERERNAWYSHRALFQAIDLFDRYIYTMHKNTDVSDKVESQYTGLIHDKANTEMRFAVCLYISVKYFATLHPATSMSEIYPKKGMSDFLESFELGFVKNCLEFNIYRDTLYEQGDDFCDVLSEKDVANLLVIFLQNYSIKDYSIKQVYRHYRENLREMGMDTISKVKW